ncbi:MAG: ribbon-helix-helix protein, CopG family [Myxococcales bacterium]|nr:ribbon-helix-helix protein, CopG family [Myxococcales bacterium]
MAKGTITIRTDPELEAQLEALAKATQRSRNWLVTEALQQYLETQRWQVEGIWQARRSMRAGRGVNFDDAMAALRAKIERHKKTD